MKRFFRRKHTIPANQQQVEQDLQNLDRAIHRDPQNSALHLQKSVALIKRGRFPEATQSIQTALRFVLRVFPLSLVKKRTQPILKHFK